MRVGRSSWSVEVPDDWSVTDHPECLTLEKSDQGALQLSSAHKQAGVVTDDDLLSFNDQSEAWGLWQPTTCGEFSGIVYEYVEGQTHWRRWFLKWGQTVVFVTYNSTGSVAERERAAVDQILSTVRTETCGDA